MAKSQRTILVTFAGRRDRMALLKRYVDEAVARGLIDEWHVWDFCRTAEDSRWLRETFPTAQATPNHSLEYFRSSQTVDFSGAPEKLSFAVRAASDVHIGLGRLSGRGASYEVILGGWNNLASAVRTFDDPGQLRDVAARDASGPLALARHTPGLFPEFGLTPVDISVRPDGLEVCVADRLLFRHAAAIAPGRFEALHRTGYGSNGDWRFPGFADRPQRLFARGPEAHFPADATFYNRAYQYYNANAEEYADDVLLKCDDDIVFIDLDGLERFVAFRRAHDEHFMIGANVVNNGVCAHFQQASGAIPADFGALELPPRGLCGTLWEDGAKAQRLHAAFLADPARFTANAGAPIVWNERFSVNFIAILGRDLRYVPDVMGDDEHDLCYGVRKRAKKSNGIYPPFVVSHLSFWRQDAAMDVAYVLEGYGALADRVLAAPRAGASGRAKAAKPTRAARRRASA